MNSNSLILSYLLCISDVDKLIFGWYSYHILNRTVTSQSSKNLTLSPASQAVFLVYFSRRGGGVLPFISHIDMCRHKGYGFCAVLVRNRVWFPTELRWCINVFVVSEFQLNKKESVIYEFEMDFKKSFCCSFNFSNDDIISVSCQCLCCVL